MMELAVCLGLGVGLGALASRPLRLYRVTGDSMVPTLRNGDRVLARRWLPWERPERDDLVILHQGRFPTVLVKRVAGIPGDALPEELPGGGMLGHDEYLLAGENAGLPTRQRFTGPVDRSQIWGKVCLRLRRGPT